MWPDLGERSAETRFRDDRLHDGGVVTRVVCAVAGLFRAARWRTDSVRSAASSSPVRSVGESGAGRAARRHHPARRLVGQAASLPRKLPAAGRMPFVVSQVLPRGCPSRTHVPPVGSRRSAGHRTPPANRMGCPGPALGGGDGHRDELGDLPPGRARQGGDGCGQLVPRDAGSAGGDLAGGRAGTPASVPGTSAAQPARRWVRRSPTFLARDPPRIYLDT
jgi:hypothetical protein